METNKKNSVNGEAERNDKHLTTQKALQELSKQHKNPN